MVFDFGALPPEVNSGQDLLRAGLGPAAGGGDGMGRVGE